METRKTLRVRWAYLAAGVAAMLFAGVIYAWSILKAPLQEAFGWTAPQLALNFTLTMCFFCLGGFVSSLAAKRVGGKCVICAGAILTAVGFILTSRLNGTSVISLYIAYGLLAGFGIGCAYVTTISTVSAWFPDKKGFCSGCLMMGFGASTLLLGSLANGLIDSIGWRRTFLLLGAVIGAVILLVGLFLRLPDSKVVLPQVKKVHNKAAEDFDPIDYTTGQMIRRFTFWRAFLCIVLLASVGNAVISFARDVVLSVGASAGAATTMVGVLAVCNGLGRIATGALFDAAGRKVTMLTANITAILAAAVTLLAVVTSSVVLCIGGLCLVGFSYGACPTLSASFIAAFYGNRYFATNFSVMNFNLMGASVVATLASSILTSSGGYTAPLLMLLILSMVALVLNLSIKKP